MKIYVSHVLWLQKQVELELYLLFNFDVSVGNKLREHNSRNTIQVEHPTVPVQK